MSEKQRSWTFFFFPKPLCIFKIWANIFVCFLFHFMRTFNLSKNFRLSLDAHIQTSSEYWWDFPPPLHGERRKVFPIALSQLDSPIIGCNWHFGTFKSPTLSRTCGFNLVTGHFRRSKPFIALLLLQNEQLLISDDLQHSNSFWQPYNVFLFLTWTLTFNWMLNQLAARLFCITEWTGGSSCSFMHAWVLVCGQLCKTSPDGLEWISSI